MSKLTTLINLVTIGREEIYIRWIVKFREFQKQGLDLSLYGGTFLKKLDLITDVYNYECLSFEQAKIPKIMWTRPNFLVHCIIRNLLAILNINKILNQRYNFIYSPSSVLDLIILPFLLKMFDKNIKWVTALDNTVEFRTAGVGVYRLVSIIAFKISLILLKKADIVYVLTRDLEKFMLDNGFPKKRLVLTGAAVESDMISKARKLSDVSYDALFIGRINKSKGIYDMLAVLSVVAEKMPDFKLAIMGEGDPETVKNFIGEINRRNLLNNIVFLGYKTGIEKFNIIKSSRCFWFFSEYESFGLALLEAVCSGLKCFTYELPIYREIYRKKELEICNKGDTAATAKRVISLFEAGDYYNKAGSELLKEYSWEKIALIEYNAMRRLYD